VKPLVVITGASSGIGEAIARRFSEAGHPLLLLARRIERVRALDLPDAMCEQVDVTDLDALRGAIARAEAANGPVDCLVNNAGVMHLGHIDTQDRREWQRMFDVNVLALLDGMQAVLGPMKERRGGTIINISSIAGVKTFLDHAAYVGSKHAVSGISETVREEVAAYGVRVVSICPGAVETELVDHTTSESIKSDYREWKDDIGGGLASDDVARTAMFIYQQPQNVLIREVVMTPTAQER
jgi:NADP-dependent 3-hydroxy acid dehydrogenase YdfG